MGAKRLKWRGAYISEPLFQLVYFSVWVWSAETWHTCIWVFHSSKCSRYVEYSWTVINKCWLSNVGHHTRRGPYCWMVSRAGEARPQETWKCFLYRYRCCFSFFWWNRLRLDRFPLPIGWNCFRSCQDLSSAALVERLRIQDGPTRIIILLCASLRGHEFDSRSFLGSTKGHNGRSIRCWIGHLLRKRMLCILIECVRRVLGRSLEY